jgi:hypothetical protein
MLRLLILILLTLPFTYTFCQENDSLFVVKKEGNWEIMYTAKERENARMLAKRFFIDAEQLEFANDEGTMKKLTEGATVYIPVAKRNFYTVQPPPLSMKHVRELYYKVSGRDDIGMLSTYSGVTKVQFRTWNELRGNTLKPGQILFVGWVKMMSKDTTDAATLVAYPAPKKVVVVDTTNNAPVPGNLDSVYNIQTNKGLNVLSEKGTAVFFDKPGKVTMYYAFHNEAARGSIIKVYYPGSGKSTYVKVLGPLPDTKLYANCIIGISSSAKEALGINDAKAWCELFYAAD